MPTALFILGHAGSGKTKLSKKWVKTRLKKGDNWVLLDKDVCGEGLANALMRALGLDENDRDSPAYKLNVRDLEYQGCLRLAAEQLKLGFNVVLPGPWTRELEGGALFDPLALGLPCETKLCHIYLDISVEKTKVRIESRANPRDTWKLGNWEVYAKSLQEPLAIKARGIIKLIPGVVMADPDMVLLRDVVKVSKKNDADAYR